MKKLYCASYGKYWKFGKPKILYLLEKASVLSIIWSRRRYRDI